MKAFVVNQITDWDKLKILINTIAASDAQLHKNVRKDQIKLYIIVAEVFQFQILEYLPSIFSILNEKLSKDRTPRSPDDQAIFEAIGETYAGLLEHSLKKSSEEDAVFVLEEAIKTLLEMVETGQPNQQQGAATSILRIIKTAPSTHFAQVTGLLLEGVLGAFKKKSLGCAQTYIECVMSIVLYSDKDVPAYIDSILGVLIEQVCNKSPLVRKAALDTIHTMCVVCADEMRYYKDEMLETVKVVKNDSDKRVVEAAQEALKAVRGLQSERDSQSEADPNPQKPIRQVSKSVDKLPQKQQPEAKAGKKGPKREYGINKQQVNPNFMKAGSDQIEIFVNEAKRPPSQPLESQERLSQTFNDTRESNFMEAESAAFQQDSFKEPPRARERPGGPQEDPQRQMRKKKEEDTLNIFKDFDQEAAPPQRTTDGGRPPQHQKVFSGMDEEHRYTPSPPPQPPRQSDRSALRQRTPEQPQARGPGESRVRREFEESQGGEQASERVSEPTSQKVVKTNDYETRQLRKLYDGLRRENAAQGKVIEHQNKRIDSLVSHVQNMTLHMNHLLAKVNQLEQNLFQISNTRSQPPQQIILPPYSFPIGGVAPQLSSLGLQQVLPQPQFQPQFQPQQPFAAHLAQPQQPDRHSAKENKWKRRTDEGKRKQSDDDEKDRVRKKDKLRVDAIPLDVRDTNEDKKARAARNKDARTAVQPGLEPEQSDGDSAHRVKAELKAYQSSASKHLESLRKKEPTPKDSEASGSDDERSAADSADESRSDLSTDSRQKARALNEALRSVLGRDSRKLLDFLSDFDHLAQFALVSRSNLQKLCVKLTELLASRAETHVGVALPWIDQFVQHGKLERKQDVRALQAGLKVVLSGGRSAKQYQQSTLEKLEALRQDLDRLV